MKNVSTISTLASHLKASAGRLSELSYDVDSAEDGYRPEGFGELMDEQFMSELEFAQRCLIMLTNLVMEAHDRSSANGDGEGGEGSVFGVGELDDHPAKPKVGG